jgi:hypothetical protein
MSVWLKVGPTQVTRFTRAEIIRFVADDRVVTLKQANTFVTDWEQDGDCVVEIEADQAEQLVFITETPLEIASKKMLDLFVAMCQEHPAMEDIVATPRACAIADVRNALVSVARVHEVGDVVGTLFTPEAWEKEQAARAADSQRLIDRHDDQLLARVTEMEQKVKEAGLTTYQRIRYAAEQCGYVTDNADNHINAAADDIDGYAEQHPEHVREETESDAASDNDAASQRSED